MLGSLSLANQLRELPGRTSKESTDGSVREGREISTARPTCLWRGCGCRALIKLGILARSRNNDHEMATFQPPFETGIIPYTCFK